MPCHLRTWAQITSLSHRFTLQGTNDLFTNAINVFLLCSIRDTVRYGCTSISARMLLPNSVKTSASVELGRPPCVAPHAYAVLVLVLAFASPVLLPDMHADRAGCCPDTVSASVNLPATRV